MAEAGNPLSMLVRKLEQHGPLSADDRQAILALPFTPRTFESATYLVREGDLPLQCGVILSGFAYRQKITGEGLRQIISIHIPGEAVDFQSLFLDVADHSVQMLTRGEVAMIPRKDFQQLVDTRPGIGHAILVNILVEASIFREWVLNLGRRDARSRLAHVLCEVAVRLNAQGLAEEYGYELPMTQEQLADALGLTPVHVNRVLKALEADGLITRNRRAVRFPDWDKMRHVGDFNQRYLHLEMQKALETA